MAPDGLNALAAVLEIPFGARREQRIHAAAGPRDLRG
jgi:hypothetical protein